MLAVGDPIPQATLWIRPGEPLTLEELARAGPFLLVFYLFDWSST